MATVAASSSRKAVRSGPAPAAAPPPATGLGGGGACGIGALASSNPLVAACLARLARRSTSNLVPAAAAADGTPDDAAGASL